MTTATAKPAKITAPMRRVLSAIVDGRPWNASHDTVQAILNAGLASYDENGVWSVTATDCKAEREATFERAVFANRKALRERHEHNLIQMPRASGYKTPA